MKAGQVAVFPLAFVANSLALRKAGTDHRLCDRFGYIRGKQMSPAVIYTKKDFSRVHCGKYPLEACVEMRYDNRWPVVAFGYYNVMGQLVIPA